MKRAIVVGLVVLFAVNEITDARIIIQEWGGHTPSDFWIDRDPITLDDIGVRILNNTQPSLPWKFKAYDSSTGAPGDIRYIVIDSLSSVGDITLNVVGGLDPYGAREVWLINLVDNGTSTNVIDEMTISGDAATDGDIQAYGLESLTIGGNLGPYDLHILGTMSGCVEMVGNFTSLTGWIVIDGDVQYPAHMKLTTVEQTGGVDVAGNFEGVRGKGDITGFQTSGISTVRVLENQ